MTDLAGLRLKLLSASRTPVSAAWGGGGFVLDVGEALRSAGQGIENGLVTEAGSAAHREKIAADCLFEAVNYCPLDRNLWAR